MRTGRSRRLGSSILSRASSRALCCLRRTHPMKCLVLVLLAFAPAPCFAECASVHVTANYTDFLTTASQLDTVIDIPGAAVEATVIYDLAQGTSHTSVTSGVGGGALSLGWADDFLIQGLADG